MAPLNRNNLTSLMIYSVLIILLVTAPIKGVNMEPKKINYEGKVNSLKMFLAELTKCMDYLDKTPIILKEINSSKTDTSQKVTLLEDLNKEMARKCTQIRFQLVGTKSGLKPDKTCEISLKKFMDNMILKIQESSKKEMNRWQELMILSDKDIMQLKCKDLVTEVKGKLVDFEAQIPTRSIY